MYNYCNKYFIWPLTFFFLGGIMCVLNELLQVIIHIIRVEGAVIMLKINWFCSICSILFAVYFIGGLSFASFLAQGSAALETTLELIVLAVSIPLALAVGRHTAHNTNAN